MEGGINELAEFAPKDHTLAPVPSSSSFVLVLGWFSSRINCLDPQPRATTTDEDDGDTTTTTRTTTIGT